MYLKDLLTEEELEIKRLFRKFPDREIMPKRLELEEDENLVAKILQDITNRGDDLLGYGKPEPELKWWLDLEDVDGEIRIPPKKRNNDTQSN